MEYSPHDQTYLAPHDQTYLAPFCPNNEHIFMFWGKNMSNNGVFSIIVCTFASK